MVTLSQFLYFIVLFLDSFDLKIYYKENDSGVIFWYGIYMNIKLGHNIFNWRLI